MKDLCCGGLLVFLVAFNMHAEAGKIISPTCTNYTCPPNYQLTVHNKCECVANAPCAPNKNWNCDTCQCECNTEEIHVCNSKQIWNSQGCRCDCLAFQLCGANMVWNSDTCSCECRSIESCGFNQWWNSQTCRCECLFIGECSDHKVWNSKTCSCQCRSPPNWCPLGSFISLDTCECIGIIEGK